MFQTILENVRSARPLIHCITNYVTANDCANVLLACGASPIMADAPEEAEEITALCAGLTLNLGTPGSRTLPAMLAAGKRANACGRPVVLDPVGAGASALRTRMALELLRSVRFAVIRGNFSEIKTLARGSGAVRGVDADAADRVTGQTLPAAAEFVREFARRTGSVAAVTGAIDLVSDGSSTFCIRNGHPMMTLVTGTGCQLSVLTAAFAAANPGHTLEAAAAAVCAMGLAGEIAHSRLGPMDGSAAYRGYLIDAISRMTPEELERGARYEMR
jgi:hydroxyethylthiazole kinase